ncbi:MAG: DnaD domain protein [Oscillospiraceae bacterium]|jgi:DnaD/phage-associated family protein|nr:DnaD domain protein [Oscillospiraceae bacterium]
MKYVLEKWGAVFAVPVEAVDGILSSASGNTVKTLLYVLRHAEKDLSYQDIANGIGCSPDEVKIALDGLKAFGIKECTSENPAEVRESSVNNSGGREETEKQRQRTGGGYLKMASEVAEKKKSSSDIAGILTVSQQIFGGPITFSQQSSLIWMYEYLKLRADVVLMLVQYCVSIDKPSFRYIETVACDWADRGINSIPDVEKELERMKTASSLVQKVLNLLGQTSKPTKQQRRFIDKWTERCYQFELVEYAYEKCVDRKGAANLPYINGILENWYKQQLVTLAQVKESEQETAFTGKPVSGQNEQSYDISIFDRHNIV